MAHLCQGHVLLNQESPWFKRRGRRMTHVTAGLKIRQEGNVQCLSSELAVLPSLKHFHCLKLVRLNSSFWEKLWVSPHGQTAALLHGKGWIVRGRGNNFVLLGGCSQEKEMCRGKTTSPALSNEEDTLIRQGRGTC